MGKKIKKVVKKTVRKITKPVEKVAKGAVGALAGGKPDVQVAPDVAPAPPAAQIIEPPSKDNVDTENEAQTESGKKKARAGGKKSLSVARSSGGGLNI